MSNRWHLESAQENFPRRSEDWQRLARHVLGCDHPLASPDYVGPLLGHFGTADVLLARRDEDGSGGMVLLQRDRAGVWGSFQPHTGPFTFGLIPDDEHGSADDAIDELIKALPGYAILLAFNKLDPFHLAVRAQRHPDRTERVDYYETLQIPTDRPFEDYWQERSKNLRRNIVKKTNRLAHQGITHQLVELRDRADLAPAVAVYSALEQSGWKGEMGTAVDPQNASGRFYVDMLDRFAARGQAAIYQLRFDTEVVASAITIRGGDMLIILKIAYDEAMSDYSPGLLMMYELHKLAFGMPDVKVIEYYGAATPRAQQWAVRLRQLYHINCYRYAAFRKAVNVIRTARRRLSPAGSGAAGDAGSEAPDS
ncbi:MAG: GNAT family N-acetyltransferase [Halioglobus sp.]|nr:GNAT family N-acetyltransferase [Halioglobus sp.]